MKTSLIFLVACGGILFCAVVISRKLRRMIARRVAPYKERAGRLAVENESLRARNLALKNQWDTAQSELSEARAAVGRARPPGAPSGPAAFSGTTTHRVKVTRGRGGLRYIVHAKNRKAIFRSSEGYRNKEAMIEALKNACEAVAHGAAKFIWPTSLKGNNSHVVQKSLEQAI